MSGTSATPQLSSRAASVNRRSVGACGAYSAPAAQEFHAPIPFQLFAFPQQHRPHLASARRVRSSARLAIETFYFDGAQHARSFYLFANTGRGQFFRSAVKNSNREIIKNDFIRPALRRFQLRCRNRGRRKIDGRNIAAKMKRHGGHFKQFDKRRRKQMLPGVLLQMIESAFPIYFAVHRPQRNLAVGDMHHGVVRFAINYINHCGVTERSGIVRLPA